MVSYWIGHFLSYGFLSVFFQCHRSPSDSFKMTDQYNIGRSMEYCIYYCILLNTLYILTCHKDIFTTGKMLFIASIDTVDPILGSRMPNRTIKRLVPKVDGLLSPKKWTALSQKALLRRNKIGFIFKWPLNLVHSSIFEGSSSFTSFAWDSTYRKKLLSNISGNNAKFPRWLKESQVDEQKVSNNVIEL